MEKARKYRPVTGTGTREDCYPSKRTGIVLEAVFSRRRGFDRFIASDDVLFEGFYIAQTDH